MVVTQRPDTPQSLDTYQITAVGAVVSSHAYNSILEIVNLWLIFT